MPENKPVNLRDIVAELSEKPSDQWIDLLRPYNLTDAQRFEVLQTLNASAATDSLRGSPTVPAASGEGMPDSVAKQDRIQSLNRFFEQDCVAGPKYRVLELIGRGGMGDVYKAQQRTPVKRLVAMKLIKPGFDTNDVIARFESERQALARMDHTGIAKVLDAGVDDRGRPFFVMEYVPGIAITAFADNNRLSVRQRLELFTHVCSAIAHAHSKAIIHRDIKSSNTLAYFADGTPVVKVIDFGIAKALTGDRLSDFTINTELGRAIGSYESMSPEQADASPDIDTRTDVYSLGVLLYELLAGAKPFDRYSFARAADDEIRRIIREVEPARPSVRLSSLGDSGTKIASSRRAPVDALTKQLRSELEWIPLKAMRKERDRRYASPLELSEDIRNYLERRPLPRGPESVRYRVRKYCERHRAAISAIAAIIILLVSGVAVSTQLAIRARKAEGDALAAEGDAKKQAVRAMAAEQTVTDQLTQVKQNLARSLIAEGDYSGQTQPAEARQRYVETLEILETLGLSQTTVKARLVELTGDEIPLMGSYGSNRGAGGFVGHSANVDAVAVSHNGFNVITASEDHTLTLWELKTGLPIRTFAGAEGHTDGVTFVDFSPDDDTVLSASNDGTIKQWGTATGKLLRTLRAQNKQVWVVAYSPDGHAALSSGLTEGPYTDMELWDLSSGNMVRTFRGHTKQVAGIAFSPDGRWALSGSHDHTIKLWDVESGKYEPDRKFEGHSGEVNCVGFSPKDGSLAVSASFDGSVRLWDVPTGTPHGKPMMAQLNGEKRYGFWRVQFSANGRFLVSASEDSKIQVWSVDTQEPIGPAFTAGAGEAMGVAFLPDSSGVVSSRGPMPGQDWSSSQSSLALWRVGPDRDLREVRHRQDALTSVAVADGNLVLLGTKGGTLEIWDAATRHTLGSVTMPGNPGAVRTVSLSRDGRRALSGSRDGKVLLWDSRTGKVLKELAGHVGAVNAVAFLPPDESDASRAVSCGDDGKLLLWELSPQASSSPIELHRSAKPITSLSVSPNGKRAMLTTDGDTGHVCLLDLTSLSSQTKPIHQDDNDLVFEADQKNPFQSNAVSWSNDGQSILYTSPSFKPGRLRLARISTTGSHASVTGKVWLAGHASRVTSKAFSPDGAMALSGDADGTVIFWDIAGRTPVKRFDGAHSKSVTGVAFSPDGDLAVTVSDDETRLWDFSRAVRERDREMQVRSARDVLVKRPDDPDALATFGEWYAFRGQCDWAIEFLEKARAGGAAVSSLTLGRCYWLLDKMPEAHKEFLNARQKNEASAFYISLYLKATEKTGLP